MCPRLRPISIMFQENRLIETLTVYENLNFAEENLETNFALLILLIKTKLLKI